MKAINDLAGKRFGKLTVIGISGRDKHMKCIWKCLCDCGTETHAPRQSLLRGEKISCGCGWRAKIAKGNPTHSHWGCPGYWSWGGMIQRCTNPKNPAYHNYGGRGILVCERWLQFSNFLEDMGQAPAGMTIERINNDGNYEKSNCVWATKAQQANNTRTNRVLELDGERKTVAQWSQASGVKYETIRGRLHRGLSLKEALV